VEDSVSIVNRGPFPHDPLTVRVSSAPMSKTLEHLGQKETVRAEFEQEATRLTEKSLSSAFSPWLLLSFVFHLFAPGRIRR